MLNVTKIITKDNILTLEYEAGGYFAAAEYEIDEYTAAAQAPKARKPFEYITGAQWRQISRDMLAAPMKKNTIDDILKIVARYTSAAAQNIFMNELEKKIIKEAKARKMPADETEEIISRAVEMYTMRFESVKPMSLDVFAAKQAVMRFDDLDTFAAVVAA